MFSIYPINLGSLILANTLSWQQTLFAAPEPGVGHLLSKPHILGLSGFIPQAAPWQVCVPMGVPVGCALGQPHLVMLNMGPGPLS